MTASVWFNGEGRAGGSSLPSLQNKDAVIPNRPSGEESLLENLKFYIDII